MRRHLNLLLLAAILSGCAISKPEAMPETTEFGPGPSLPLGWLRPGQGQAPAACSVTAAGGGLQLVERGIGGTGAVEKPLKPSGGESVVPQPTGVSALITGFGSVCLAGLEVGLAPGATVTVDGVPEPRTSLRAGQHAALTARWVRGQPETQAIDIRHAVVGPVEGRVGNSWIVDGQRVLIARGAWVEAVLAPGAWVAVSGLHTPDGGIVASRIDPAPRGRVLIRARLSGKPGAWRLGPVKLVAPGLAPFLGHSVLVTGTLTADGVVASAVRIDQMLDDTRRYFGPDVKRLAMQMLVRQKGEMLHAFVFTLPLPRGAVVPNGSGPVMIGLQLDGKTDVAISSIDSPAAPAHGVAGGFGINRGDVMKVGVGLDRGDRLK